MPCDMFVVHKINISMVMFFMLLFWLLPITASLGALFGVCRSSSYVQPQKICLPDIISKSKGL